MALDLLKRSETASPLTAEQHDANFEAIETEVNAKADTADLGALAALDTADTAQIDNNAVFEKLGRASAVDLADGAFTFSDRGQFWLNLFGTAAAGFDVTIANGGATEQPLLIVAIEGDPDGNTIRLIDDDDPVNVIISAIVQNHNYVLRWNVGAQQWQVWGDFPFGATMGGLAFFDIASQAEAEAGTSNTVGMTPLRTAEAIAALGAPAPTQVTSDASPFSLTDARRLYFNIEILSHQASVDFEVPAAAAAGSKWYIRPKHDSCTVSVTGDAGSVNGTSGGSARLVNGGAAIVEVDSNAGAAPVVLVRGDVIVAPTGVSGTKTYDNDDHGQDFEITTAGTQTFGAASTYIDGWYCNIFNDSGSSATLDGVDADHTLTDNAVVTVKKLGTGLWAFGSDGVTVLDAA